jgi:uncharacterized protein (UPF0264 family)
MRLLISVRDRIEARLALAGGADLIDVKEPRRGALGAADPRIWRGVLEVVNGAAPVSAALGELAHGGGHRLAPLAGGLTYVKLGLAGMASSAWPAAWRRVVSLLPAGVAHVAVCYADWKTALAPPPGEIIASATQLSSAAVLFDTFEKARGGLFQLLAASELHELVVSVRERGMKVVLGGSLTLDDLDQAERLAPDYVAVRGAVCRGGREAAIDANLVRQFAEALAGLGGEKIACKENSRFA